MSPSGYQARAPKRRKKRIARAFTPAPCPVCCFLTCAQEQIGDFGICPVCWWEDDGLRDDHLDFPSGANKGLSIALARANFAKYEAAHKEWVDQVRGPLAEEIPRNTKPTEETD